MVSRRGGGVPGETIFTHNPRATLASAARFTARVNAAMRRPQWYRALGPRDLGGGRINDVLDPNAAGAYGFDGRAYFFSTTPK